MSPEPDQNPRSAEKIVLSAENAGELQRLETVGLLAGGFAHELNNLLAAVIGNLELVQLDVPESSPATPWLTRTMQAALRARALAQEIGDFSRHTEEEKFPVELAAPIDAAVKVLRATLPRFVKVELELPTCSTVVKADATQIRQLLLALVAHAWHKMPLQGGQIRVQLTEQGTDDRRTLVLRVSSPVAAATEESSATERKRPTASGLALPVADAIAKNHGATLRVRETPDTFVADVTFPT